MPPSGVLKYGAKELADIVQSKTFSATPDSVWLSDYRSWAVQQLLGTSTLEDIGLVAYNAAVCALPESACFLKSESSFSPP
jgi:hypothetical protein